MRSNSIDRVVVSKTNPHNNNALWIDTSNGEKNAVLKYKGNPLSNGGSSGGSGGGEVSSVKIAYPIRTLMINDGTDFSGLVYKKADFETANLLLTVVYGESKPMYIEYITILPRTDNNISIVNELSSIYNGLTQCEDMSTYIDGPDWIKEYFLLYPDISETSGNNSHLFILTPTDFDFIQEDEIALYISRSYP